jgi:hypothetical protein
MRLATPEGIGNRERKYVGRLERVFFYKGNSATLRQIQPLPDSQPPLNFANYLIPAGLSLKRGPLQGTSKEEKKLHSPRYQPNHPYYPHDPQEPKLTCPN